MAIREDALNFLRQVFGRERAERDRAESPSAEAEKHIPSSIYSMWGRDDVGGLLTVSQNLMDRYADYEQMDDYPDINCLVADTKIYIVEGSIIKPARIHDLAANGGGPMILSFDTKTKKLVAVQAENPRITGDKVEVVEIGFSNGEKLKCTPDHKFLTEEHGYINASDLTVGTAVVSAWAAFDPRAMSAFVYPASGRVLVTSAAIPAGVEAVYDITTRTRNFLANGVIVHNSANHYFTNDATQPDIDTGKTVWVHSQDEAIRDMTDVLLNKRLRIEDDIWSMVYTTVKYGNAYEEVLITDNGVVGLNSLPVPTMRRVEQSNGAIIGFVQDITGKFTQDTADLRGMLAGQSKVPDHVALFEEWQVLHTRLRGTVRRCPYGFAIGDGARWIWKRLILLEDSMLIYKLTRSPARFAFYIDVTDIPGDKVESFLRKAKQDLRKQKLVNPRNQRLDMRFNPMDNMEDFFIAVRENRELARVEVLQGPDYQCLAGDTRIPLLDGSTITIREMAEAGGEHWVYSCHEDGRVVPGVAHSARISSESAEIWEVKLDNNEIIRCTWNHPFMTKDGRWVFARDLGPGDSLMPLHRRITSKKAGDRLDGYEMLYDPASDREVYTHQMSYDALHEEAGWIKGTVVHHESGPLNNRPDHLRLVSRREHAQIHIDNVRRLHTPEVRAKVREAPAYMGSRNHKVAAVRRTGQFETVYDLTVDGTHSFAIAAGVFVHNSTEDVDYFARKLHGVLKVPRSYLGQEDAVPARSILSFEDVRAARVTMGIQREVRNTIRRLVQIDLAARGINPFNQDLQVMMTVPSGIYELAHNEIKNARADFAQRVQPFVSKRYIQERILKLSDDEIEEIDKQTKKEQEEQMELQQKMGGAPPGGPGGAPESPGMGKPGDNPMHPGNMDVGPPPGQLGRPNTPSEWKSYDNSRRLEEKKDQVSKQNHQEILDKFNQLLATNKTMAAKFAQSNQFMQEFRHAAFARNGNGKLIAAPSGKGHARR